MPREINMVQRQWNAELEARQENVLARKQVKTSYYEKRRQRKAKQEDDLEFIISPGRVRGYNAVARQVVKNTLTVIMRLLMRATTLHNVLFAQYDSPVSKN